MSFSDSQLSIKVNEASHLTCLKYPIVGLLTNAAEVPTFPAPRNAASMHIPVDLVSSPQVIANANTENEHETSFFTIDRALDAANLDPQPSLNSTYGTPLEKLIDDVGEFQQFIGNTTLHLVVYRSPGACDNESMVRVQRDSAVRRSNGAWFVSSSRYDFPLHDLLELAEQVPAPSFIVTMDSLISRENSRAIRHFRFMSPPEHHSLDGYGSLAPRVIDYAAILETAFRAADVTSLNGDDKTCYICLCDYKSEDSPDNGPTMLPCGHHLGDVCLRTWSEGSGIDLQCPCCRTPVIKPADAKAHHFGTQNGVYQTDARYTAHENFERSCADLDDHPPAREDGTKFLRRLPVLRRAMSVLLQGALLEGESSTPLHLQAARYPEMKVVTDWTELAWRSLDDGIPIQDARYEGPRSMIHAERIQDWIGAAQGNCRYQVLADAVGPSDRFMTQPMRLSLLQDTDMNQITVGFPIRPGFEPFLHRLLTRAVHFQRCRQCNCLSGFHQHALRTYYNVKEAYE